jgi:hypothetical protein
MENRIVELEIENSRLQRLVVELLLTNQQLRDGKLPGMLGMTEQDSLRTGDSSPIEPYGVNEMFSPNRSNKPQNKR